VEQGTGADSADVLAERVDQRGAEVMRWKSE